MDWPLYERIITQLFEPVAEGDGIPDDELDTAEAQLGHPLPPLLRQLYNLCGRRGDLHQASELLLLPTTLQVREGYLPFYQSAEQVPWAVSLNHGDDPPVFRQNGSDWEPDYPTLSQFLLAMLFWQAVNGGVDYYAHGTVPVVALRQLPAGWERIPLGGDWDLEALWGGKVALVYSKH
uniref:SMI1/KNR4 family protein n=1 Tax=Armatimonas sp. TaxID=1872638 RepID=UPI00286CB31B